MKFKNFCFYNNGLQYLYVLERVFCSLHGELWRCTFHCLICNCFASLGPKLNGIRHQDSITTVRLPSHHVAKVEELADDLQ